MSAKTMKAFVITAPHTAHVQMIERWVPREGEILVRSKAVAICTLERRLFSGRLRHYPAIGGHELAGIVEWADEGKTGLKAGDRVAVDVMNRCGQCYYCLKGSNNICVELAKSRNAEFFIAGGGLAEYVLAAANQVVRLPEDLDLEEASLIEPLACCIHSIKRGQVSAGDTVAILGAGTMGMLHMLLAMLRSARVIVSDPDDVRLGFARDTGAYRTINPRLNDPIQSAMEATDGRGADVVFVTASSMQAGQQAIAMVAPTGRVVLYGSLHPSEALQLDWNAVHYREVTITGSANNTYQDFQEAADLLGSRAVNLQPLVSKVIGLGELPEELMSHPSGSTQRVVVRL